MLHNILLLCALFLLAAGRHFETSVKFTLLGRNKGWVYLDKMTFAPGTARIAFETATEGLPYGRNSELFLQAVPESKWNE